MITSIEQLQAWLAKGEYVQIRKGVDSYTLADMEGNVVTYFPQSRNAYADLRIKTDEAVAQNIETQARELEIKQLHERLSELQSI